MYIYLYIYIHIYMIIYVHVESWYVNIIYAYMKTMKNVYMDMIPNP